ncbi:homoserine kinase [soil metagenome]
MKSATRRTPLRRAVVRVPASTSNLGPGYDCLGVALAIHNEVTVERAAAGSALAASPPHAHGMVEATAAAFFERSGAAAFGFGWSVSGEVPESRGLGSSVTIRLGVLAGLNALSGDPLDQQALFEICTALEGHPDNAGPGAFGGFVVAGSGGQVLRFAVDPALKFVLLIPGFEVLTETARAVLPDAVGRRDAVVNVGNAAVITAAFACGDYAKLRGAFGDHLHQPFRAHLVPQMGATIAAGSAAGALGGFLSGSGSGLACLVFGADASLVGAAMQAGFAGRSEVIIVEADPDGATVLEAS